MHAVVAAQGFIDDPSSIITILGTAAPQTAIFFTTYVMLQVTKGPRMSS